MRCRDDQRARRRTARSPPGLPTIRLRLSLATESPSRPASERFCPGQWPPSCQAHRDGRTCWLAASCSRGCCSPGDLAQTCSGLSWRCVAYCGDEPSSFVSWGLPAARRTTEGVSRDLAARVGWALTCRWAVELSAKTRWRAVVRRRWSRVLRTWSGTTRAESPRVAHPRSTACTRSGVVAS
jgi:hypothetical protein